MYKKIASFLLMITTLISLLTGCNFSEENSSKIPGQDTSYIEQQEQTQTTHSYSDKKIEQPSIDASFTTKEEVSLYLQTYQTLPKNFITKEEAKSLGWDPKSGNLWDVTDHKSIGGDRFSNREGVLPNKKGRKWYECDVNYKGGRRGAERIVFSNDGLIYYTRDHYQSFTKLYGEEE